MDIPYLVFSFETVETAKIFLLLILLICSALISGSEVAFFSLSPSFIKEASTASNKSERIIAHLRKNPRRLLAIILLLNNLINIATVLVFASLTSLLFEAISQPWLQFLLEIGIITTVVLLFGEILPKVYANKNPEGFARRMALPIYALDQYVFFALTYPMSYITFILQKRLANTATNISVDHLSQALEMTDVGETTKDEQKILKGIVTFGTTETKQVMCPRIDVFALEEQTTFVEVIQQVVDKGFSRVPIYRETIDSVIGVLYVKDLLPYLEEENMDWTSLLREPYYVPENKKLDDLLEEFQSKRIHLAVVVDEYGGTSGVISLEDVIEQIVGDISDEFDETDVSYSKLNDSTYVFEGKTSLKDFYSVLKLTNADAFEAKKGESETIAGFVLEQLGSFPKTNTAFRFENVVFTIEAVDRKRIKQLKVKIHL
ncbi:MAG: gliding motility-associated protein GldE [Flavobacteriaceae bacterium]|nr:gliding motility-associated protein GldE [Flavobacteriaceae bacterium]